MAGRLNFGGVDPIVSCFSPKNVGDANMSRFGRKGYLGDNGKWYIGFYAFGKYNSMLQPMLYWM